MGLLFFPLLEKNDELIMLIQGCHGLLSRLTGSWPPHAAKDASHRHAARTCPWARTCGAIARSIALAGSLYSKFADASKTTRCFICLLPPRIREGKSTATYSRSKFMTQIEYATQVKARKNESWKCELLGPCWAEWGAECQEKHSPFGSFGTWIEGADLWGSRM